MILLCFGLLLIGGMIAAKAFTDWVFDWYWPEPVEASSASGFDMFCDEHFKEALDHITDRYPEHSVGFCKALWDEEFDTDESMRCGYPECAKESTHEIHWIKEVEE